jgi:hypothetical protein
MTSNNAAYLTDLHNLLNQYFNMEEVRTLCFNLGVDYENISGQGKSAWIRELLLSLGRQGHLDNLVALAQQERPHVNWPPVPPDLEIPAAAESANSTPVIQHSYYGDVVHGDKTGGDKITVGNISGSQGVAIGRGARADVQVQSGIGERELMQLFAPLLAEVAQQEPAAVAQVQALKAEVARGDNADDEKMADLISDIADAAPSVVEGLVNLFTNAVLAKVAGSATKYVLRRLRK